MQKLLRSWLVEVDEHTYMSTRGQTINLIHANVLSIGKKYNVTNQNMNIFIPEN